MRIEPIFRESIRENAFWAKILRYAPDQCWIWTGARTCPNGHGRFYVYDRLHLSHRVAYTLAYGDIPEGMHVCHTCDNPPCVNPAHLFLGTHQDNMLDKIAKGRAMCVKGEAVTIAKLNPQKVHEIRALCARGVPQIAIARHYGVTPRVIQLVREGKTWRHVPTRIVRSLPDL